MTKHNVFGGPPEDPSCVVIASNILALKSPFRELSDAADFFFHEFPVILNQLRYVSRYARFPRKYESAHIREVEEKELAGFDLPSDRKSGALPRFNLEAALSHEFIDEFASLPTDYRPPIFAELLLDSIEALDSLDFKKSILYAAIAAETLAATVLEQEYKNLLSRSDCGEQYRVVDLRHTSGGTKRCDPIYEALAGSNLTNQMRRLLHERPLYLLSRSVLVENKELYDSIISLYKTRNEIAHLGEAEICRNSRKRSYEEIAASVRDVAKLFEWYGESGRYPVLDQMVMLGA